jgi:hypothetical protein
LNQKSHSANYYQNSKEEPRPPTCRKEKNTSADLLKCLLTAKKANNRQALKRRYNEIQIIEQNAQNKTELSGQKKCYTFITVSLKE